MKLPFRVLLILTAFFALSILPSCRFLYPNQMFRQKDYQYFDLVQKQIDQYLIQPGDAFTLQIFTRDGFKLVDVIGGGENATASAAGRVGYSFNVDHEGVVRLPVLGYFYVKGYTETELERVLAEKYASLFVDPWVSVRVNNRRVFVFNESNANIQSLQEFPISLIEVIARSGGLDANAKAYKIKVVRGDIKNPQIYLVDLSTLEGIRRADLTVQPNDIILIERKRRVVTDVLREITPYTSAITTVTTLVILFRARFSGQ